ncbi:hypothetical protein LC605_25160 [Nostoc sp. CHAB 5836]|uniref:hypothetical protein n=1 Tax=Nostoc sp. CHAB 5836 TaxID=2780404 RepID=UPI001E4467CE|nr:hypothetical protein [Nostoc sp. CHAB 5836]MCC5618313.1 hypothetical protein [Nostoc sp. CHAB 5836]
MKVITITYQKAEIELSIQELEIFSNALTEDQNALTEFEFETRLGVSYRQASGFLESLIKEIGQSAQSFMNISCSLYEITLLNNLLNEVCFGITLHDFETKVGMPKEQVKQVLDSINQVMNQMESIREDRKILAMPSQSDFIQSEKKCCLEADGYLVTFYFKKLVSIKNSVGIFIVLNFASTDFIQFVISSVPKTISFEDLGNFIKELDKYTALTEQDIKGSAIPFQIFKSSLFQVQVIERGVTSNSEEYLNLNFMLSSAQARGNIMQPFIGVQGAVALTNLRTFILSMREVLIDLSK